MSNSAWATYNCIDAAVTEQIWNIISSDAKEQGYFSYYREAMQAYEPLLFMQVRGLKINQEALAKAKEEAADKLAEAEAKLNEEVGRPINALSPKQVAAYFYGELALPPYRGPRGSVTTDDTAMSRLYRKGYKAAKLVQDVRSINKLKGTYLDVSLDDDGRIRCTYNLRGTSTGRLSSQQNIFGTGTNLQNLPPEFKYFIVADDNEIFFNLDKARAEWVVTAYACGDPQMIKALEEGLDIHVHTASLITGLSPEIIERESEIVGKTTDRDTLFQLRMENIPEIFDQARFLFKTHSCRQGGKHSNHGLNYMEGYSMFGLLYEIPEPEAKEIVNGYRYNAYCNLPVWWDAIKMQLQKDRTLVNCFGQKRRFLAEWSDKLVKQAVAYIPQSTVVHIINRGMANIYYDDSPEVQKVNLAAQVHDNLLSQYRVNDWTNMAKAIHKCVDHINPTMTYGGRSFQIGTDLEIGLNWGDGHPERNPQGMTKVKLADNITEQADRLEEMYKRMKETA